jgi:hypothetical protein
MSYNAMKKLQRIIIVLLLILGVTPTVYALPTGRSEQNIYPFITNTYELGTSTLRWFNITGKNGFFENITVTGVCTGCGGSSSGGSGNVSTSSQETATFIPFWTSTNGTPALLSGGDAGFAWNNTLKQLTATNFVGVTATITSATTTSLFATTASTTNLFYTVASGGNLTSTGLGTFSNLLSNGSSTLQNFTFRNATGTAATTTSFAIPGIASALLKTNANGSVIPAVLGTDYINSAEQNYKEAAKYATTAALPTVIYNNGSSGVGATLTGASVGALSLDSGSPSVNDRVLVKNQSDQTQNGIYKVTAAGSGIAVFVMTRTTDFDEPAEIMTGDGIFVTAGTTQSSTTWAYTGIDSPTIGTNNLTFVQIAGQGSFSAGNGISISGTTISQDFTFGGTYSGANIFSNITLSTTTSATTTTLFATTASSTNLFSSSLNAGLVTLGNATSTNFFSTTASTSNLYLATGACSGSNALNIVAGKVTCGAVSTPGGGGGNSKFATTTSTVFPNAIYTNGGLNTLVGIGTTTPAFQLQVASSTGLQLSLTDGSLTSSQWGFRNAGGNLYISTSSPSTFATSTNTSLSINGTNGFVGIGTSSPALGLFSVEGGSNITNTYLTGSVNNYMQLNIQNRNSGSSASSDLVATADNGSETSHYINLGINGSTGGGSPFTTANHSYLYSVADVLNIGSLGSAGQLRFHTTGGVSSPVERFRIDSNGFSGFGTTTPQWMLQIATSTRSQLTLSSTVITDNHLSFRWVGNNFYLATSSPSGNFATSSTPIMAVDSNANITFSNSVSILGNATATNATTTALFTTTASTSNLFLGTGTCSGASALNVVGGKVTCGSVTASGGTASFSTTTVQNLATTTISSTELPAGNNFRVTFHSPDFVGNASTTPTGTVYVTFNTAQGGFTDRYYSRSLVNATLNTASPSSVNMARLTQGMVGSGFGNDGVRNVQTDFTFTINNSTTQTKIAPFTFQRYSTTTTNAAGTFPLDSSVIGQFIWASTTAPITSIDIFTGGRVDQAAFATGTVIMVEGF